MDDTQHQPQDHLPVATPRNKQPSRIFLLDGTVPALLFPTKAAAQAHTKQRWEALLAAIRNPSDSCRRKMHHEKAKRQTRNA